jgi:spore coat protein H
MLSSLATGFGLFWLLVGIHLEQGQPGPTGLQIGGPGAELFAGTNVPAFKLEIDATNLEELRQRPREWAKATLRLEDNVYERVAVHIKGSQGSLQPIDAKPSLTVSFNRFVKGRKFHGLSKIHFNNCAEDPSFMTEILCSELCRAAGLPAARSAHATLSLNGRALGLYIFKEGLTKEFLAQYFEETGGNLYDGGFRKDIDTPLERIGGHGPDDQKDRLALLRAARQSDRKRRWDQLRQVLDTDRFMSLLAMSTILWNWDGYPMARNNYRIYHDPAADKMVFIPHGMDQMFWEPQGSIYPPMRGLVAAAVMGVPEGRALYVQRLAALHTNVFRVATLHERIDDLTALIRPYRADAPRRAARLKQQIAGRWQSIDQQLRQNGSNEHAQ